MLLILYLHLKISSGNNLFEIFIAVLVFSSYFKRTPLRNSLEDDYLAQYCIYFIYSFTSSAKFCPLLDKLVLVKLSI